MVVGLRGIAWGPRCDVGNQKVGEVHNLQNLYLIKFTANKVTLSLIPCEAPGSAVTLIQSARICVVVSF